MASKEIPRVLRLRVTSLLFSLTPLLVAGCASMSVEECQQANWEEVGQSDGAKGYPATWVSEHRSACAEAGIEVDYHGYKRGYQTGLIHFCTAENAFFRGQNGQRVAQQCSAAGFESYKWGYRQGLVVYELNQQVKELVKNIKDLDNEMDVLLLEITEKTKELSIPELNQKQRRKVKETRERLQSTYERLAHEKVMMTAEHELAVDNVNEANNLFRTREADLQ